MPKYWGKQIFSLGSFLEVGQKQKSQIRKIERPKVSNNNGQLRIAISRKKNNYASFIVHALM